MWSFGWRWPSNGSRPLWSCLFPTAHGCVIFIFIFILFFLLFSSFHDCTYAKKERKKYLRNRQGQQDRLCIPDSETFDGRGRVKECFKYK